MTNTTLQLGGRTVVITGATGGLGRSLARSLRDRRANLVLLDLDGEAASAQAEALGGAGVAIGMAADVRDLSSLEDAMRWANDHFGRIDVVVAGAGIAAGAGPIDLEDLTTFERTVDINLTGVWRTFRAALPYVVHSHGHLLAVSSLAAFVHNPMMGAYPASKAGVWAMCDMLRLELAHQGVTVGSAHPTFFRTPLVDQTAGSPAFMHLMHDFTGMFSLTSIEGVTRGIVRGIERRQAHVVAPRHLRLAALAPGLVGPVVARLGFRGDRIAKAYELARDEARVRP